jgi:hypothetical protein
VKAEAGSGTFNFGSHHTLFAVTQTRQKQGGGVSPASWKLRRAGTASAQGPPGASVLHGVPTPGLPAHDEST